MKKRKWKVTAVFKDDYGTENGREEIGTMTGDEITEWVSEIIADSYDINEVQE